MAFDKTKFLTRLKKITIVILWVALCAGLLVSLAFIHKQEKGIKCTEVKVHIEPDNETAAFVDRDMVLETIRKDGNENKIKGTLIEKINLPKLEYKLQHNPMIKSAEVYSDMNGVLNIHIEQRRPILRVFNAFDETFYMDDEGLKMPVSPDFTAHTVVANGYIFEHGNGRDTALTQVLRDLVKIATYVDKDTFWNAQIEQIFVTAESEFMLIPTVGNHVIDLGDANDLEDKFTRLFLFYREAISRVGWNKYSSISARYKNQIVCKKKNNQ